MERTTPDEYYLVDLTSSYMKENRKSIMPKPVAWSHRWDVVGNVASRQFVGQEPMDAVLEKNLTKRGYKILRFGNEPDEDLRSLLESRGIGLPREAEWLAFLSWWRRGHVKGPEDKPHIPSVRALDPDLEVEAELCDLGSSSENSDGDD